jgi:hypothetical protein
VPLAKPFGFVAPDIFRLELIDRPVSAGQLLQMSLASSDRSGRQSDGY